MRRRLSIRTHIGMSIAAVMLLMLLLIGFLSYSYVSTLLTNKSQRYAYSIEQQSSGRLETLVNGLDESTLQIAMDYGVQKVLERSRSGQEIRSADIGLAQEPVARMMGRQEVRLTIGVYDKTGTLLPLDTNDPSNEDSLPRDWKAAADRQSGHLIWLHAADEPVDERSPLIGIRQIRLESDHYLGGGYILIRVPASEFYYLNGAAAGLEGSMFYLLNGNSLVEIYESGDVTDRLPVERVIRSDESATVWKGETYRLVHGSKAAKGLSLVMVVPNRALSQGLDGLGRLFVIFGAVGTLLVVAVSYLLSSLVTKPIRGLSRMLQSSSDGTFKRNTQTYRSRELQELNASYNEMAAGLNKLIDEGYKLQIAGMHAEMKALQARIHPHFLYNTLEAFYWSLFRRGEAELARSIVSLSNLFRYSIRQDKQDGIVTVTLADELDHVRHYLSLMSMRMGNRLSWEINAEPGLLKQVVPKLIVQPLVENAILHGIEPAIGPGYIRIEARYATLTEESFELKVSDSGASLHEEAAAELNRKLQGGAMPEGGRSGVGLYYVNRLIQLQYGTHFGLNLRTSAEPPETIALLKLPTVDPKGMEHE
ncbi:sensor histidine kinase [Paenibacillus kobensis]|uniref:sensor histidine kinase n=1 Tax=Paenibacillus kobensis TaxID=59841 RepID=UPI000FD7CDFA|nr:sensor histidine kinase [Paenibacillus kobensis]